ncbi:serine protease [Coprinopsis cinerea okayama7|uniref:Serine protease n=1 Tax=Coprinopsis cinerea (strain Okayama-7 / 130 / ATCC MYA-4618 / FGSC 9003) TaxID=240176 RepID=A8N5I4_COPC7|nr:serine protease [Coprinopsis cinerea okayama7\|eukprot:XP_001830129.1 serine protease [Coprinopsis cinerea okayama7\
MRFFAAFAAATVLLAEPVLSAPGPSLKSVERFPGQTTGKYIVKLRPGVSRKQWIRKLRLAANTVNWGLINGFAGILNDQALNTLRESEDVEYITEDGIMYTMSPVTQSDAPWGLQRVSQAARLSNTDVAALDYQYTYDSSAGSGVDIYIADTGILVSHSQFGGRARWGGTFGVTGTTDGHGHGTHCAGTAAGAQFGVAKNASLIAVKVLTDGGSGSIAGIVSGLDWIRTQVAASGRPSVVSMSLGGSASTALDNAVASLTAAGIHVTVAAGNDNRDAANTSPARTPSAITVGATDIQDGKASFSNFGAAVDVFAPGQNVISAWIGASNSATNSISGTSMATPHVAGLVAYLISKDGNISPAAMEAKIKDLSVKGAVTGLPSTTANNLAQIGPL